MFNCKITKYIFVIGYGLKGFIRVLNLCKYENFFVPECRCHGALWCGVIMGCTVGKFRVLIVIDPYSKMYFFIL